MSANGVTTSFVLCGTSVGRSKKGVELGRSHMFKHFHKRNSTSKKLHLPANLNDLPKFADDKKRGHSVCKSHKKASFEFYNIAREASYKVSSQQVLVKI